MKFSLYYWLSSNIFEESVIESLARISTLISGEIPQISSQNATE